MNRLKKVLSLILAAAMLFSIAAMVTGCGEEPVPTEKPTDSGSSETGSYSITIKTAGGMPMADIAAYV